MKRSPSLLSLLLLAPLAAQAQIEFPGEPYSVAVGIRAHAPVEELPAVDAAGLMAEDEARLASGVKGPYRFGFNHTVDLGTDNSGAWTILPNGDRMWRLALHCPQAFSINFVLGEYVMPEGARLFVSNEQGDRLGAFTAESAGDATELGVTQLAGDRILVEYDEPAAAAGQGRLRITQVTHAYRDILGLAKGLNDSGTCNNNVICPEGDPWRSEIASVAMITVGGSGICTGTLINNCANDGTPYFLTARHCTQGANVGTWTFRFKWESPQCTPTTNGPTNKTVSGATLLTTGAGSDVALLRLNTTPPAGYNVYYSGWDKSGTAPTSSTVIHHPSGDIKKISFDNSPAVTGDFNGATCWHILTWDDGTTEPGSSGSALWDQDHHIIGQLYGGQAYCAYNYNDYFGKFSVSYPLLDGWLGDCGPILEGYDPNAQVGIRSVEAARLGVYPNPGTGLFTVMPDQGLEELVVRDALGREVLRQRVLTTGSATIDLSAVPEGIYSVEARGAGRRAVAQLAVQH